MADEDTQLTAEDLFRPFTTEQFVKKRMVKDFDKYVRHGAAVHLMKNADSTSLKALGISLWSFIRLHMGIFFIVLFSICVLGALVAFSEGILQLILAGVSLLTTIFGLIRFILIPSRKELEVKFAEDNQDAIIKDSLPHSFNNSIFDKWPGGYQSSNKTPSHERSMQSRIKSSKDNIDSTILHHYEDLFGPNSKIRPEAYYMHEWQMVGVWALATPKPEKDAKWEERKDLEEFAKREFAKAILHTVKNHDGLDLSERRKQNFIDKFDEFEYIENLQSKSQLQNDAQMVTAAILSLCKGM